VLRAGAVRPPVSRCPNCARPAQAGDQFCATCGCPLPSGADHDRQG
jgi:predicted amidophosphoribosyltransferase